MKTRKTFIGNQQKPNADSERMTKKDWVDQLVVPAIIAILFMVVIRIFGGMNPERWLRF